MTMIEAQARPRPQQAGRSFQSLAAQLAAGALAVSGILALPLLTVAFEDGGEILSYTLLLLPIAFAHFWKWHWPTALPFPAVFVAGIVTDIITAGPLGHWSFIYLVAALLSQLAGGIGGERSILQSWFDFVLVSLFSTALVYLLISLFRSSLVDIRPIATAYVGLVLAYPLMALPLYAMCSGLAAFAGLGRQE